MGISNDSELKRLMLLMNQAFEKLERKVTPLDTERLSELLYQVMSARYRIFHTMEHIFNASEGLAGVGAFSALFHDVVYYQVDKRIHPLLASYLKEFSFDDRTNECTLPDLQSEKWLDITAKIFGFQKGQVLNPLNGLNEFLSAVAGARVLHPHLTEWQTIQIIAAIEATIPFRNQADPKGSPFDLLRARLESVSAEYKISCTKNEQDEAIRIAIALANQDIASFYSEDLGEFVSGTWNLILENNPIFKNPLYTVVDYRKALQKVRGFFSFLKSDHVVHEWGGVPPLNRLQAMQKQVALNLTNALHYLDLKLVEITILEVYAMSSGGDAPYFLMIGENGGRAGEAPIERFFKNSTIRGNQQMNQAVYYVLKHGRKASSSFDFSHSPIAAYLYESLSHEEVSRVITQAQDFHAGKIDGKAYLQSFRPEILEPIAKGVSEISWSRKVSF